MTVSGLSTAMPEGRTLTMPRAGSIPNMGGERRGLCVPSWAVCTGSEPCNTVPLPLLLTCPYAAPQPAVGHDQSFTALPPLPLAPGCMNLRKVITDWWGQSESVLEMRCKSSKEREYSSWPRTSLCSFYCAFCVEIRHLLRVWLTFT